MIEMFHDLQNCSWNTECSHLFTFNQWLDASSWNSLQMYAYNAECIDGYKWQFLAFKSPYISKMVQDGLKVAADK